MTREYKKTNGLIKTWRNPYECGFNTTRAKQVQFEPGVTVLTGCNGIGKTTLLINIKDVCRQNNVAVMAFDNLTDGGHNAMDALMWNGNTEAFISMFAASEGERISQNVGYFAASIGNRMRNEFASAPEVWLLFDATDSGLSVDHIAEIKEDLFETILEDQKDKDVYIVISANEYELARGERCLDVVTGKYTSFKDYEDYRNFILKTREIKNKRYEKANEKAKRKQDKN